MVKEPALIPIVEILFNTEGVVNKYCNFSQFKTTFNLLIKTHDQQEHTQDKFIVESQSGKPLILPITTKLLFTNSFFLLLQKRMVLHPIYQQLLEGGYNPLFF